MSADLEKHTQKLKQDRAALLGKIKNIHDATKEAPELVAKLEAIHNELDPLLGQLNSWWSDNRKLRYQEAGQWARHYSTVRMAVTTITITTCVTMVAWKWKTGGDIRDVLNPVALLWALGVGIFQVFTHNSLKELNSQLRHGAKLPYNERDPNAGPKQASVCWDAASWAIWMLSALFVIFAFTGARESMHCGFKALLVLTLLAAPIWAWWAERRLKQK